MGSGHGIYLAGLGLADPEFNRVGSEIHEGESLSVSGPDWPARARSRGKSDMNLSAIGDVHEREVPGARGDTVTAWGIVLAVVLWLHASTGKAQERRRDPRNRRVVLH